MTTETAATKTARSLRTRMGWNDSPDVSIDWAQDEAGNWLLLIAGTGDCHGGAYAYMVDDVQGWLDGLDDDATPDYSADFCQSLDPVVDQETAAHMLAEHGVHLFDGGCEIRVAESA
jgi:hypothetical protein